MYTKFLLIHSYQQTSYFFSLPTCISIHYTVLHYFWRFFFWISFWQSLYCSICGMIVFYHKTLNYNLHITCYLWSTRLRVSYITKLSSTLPSSLFILVFLCHTTDAISSRTFPFLLIISSSIQPTNALKSPQIVIHQLKYNQNYSLILW